MKNCWGEDDNTKEFKVIMCIAVVFGLILIARLTLICFYWKRVTM
jgi:hypothetical protein